MKPILTLSLAVMLCWNAAAQAAETRHFASGLRTRTDALRKWWAFSGLNPRATRSQLGLVERANTVEQALAIVGRMPAARRAATKKWLGMLVVAPTTVLTDETRVLHLEGGGGALVDMTYASVGVDRQGKAHVLLQYYSRWYEDTPGFKKVVRRKTPGRPTLVGVEQHPLQDSDLDGTRFGFTGPRPRQVLQQLQLTPKQIADTLRGSL